MKRVAALVGLLALAACGGDADSAPETVAKGVDVEAELAALTQPNTAARTEAFWTNEGVAGTALWVRALATCCRSATLAKEPGSLLLPRPHSTPACEPVFARASGVFFANDPAWQQRSDFFGAPVVKGELADVERLERRTILQALRSSTYDANINNHTLWRREIQGSTDLLGDAFAYCASAIREQPRPNCVALIRSVWDLAGSGWTSPCQAASWLTTDLVADKPQ